MTDNPALVLGPPSALGTVALHGAGGTPELNFPFLHRLAERGRVVAPYYPGTGPAPRSAGPLRVEELAGDALRAADAAGLQRFDLLGYSLGTTVAVHLAATRPDRVRRLVLTAGFAAASPSLRLAVAVWLSLLDGDRPTLGRFLAWAASSEVGLNGVDDPEALAGQIAAAVPAGTPEQAGLAALADVRAELARVRAPTLVVLPRGDRLVDPAHSVALAEGIPGARLAELPAGHDVAGEAGEQWWDVLAEFLEVC